MKSAMLTVLVLIGIVPAIHAQSSGSEEIAALRAEVQRLMERLEALNKIMVVAHRLKRFPSKGD